MKKLIIFVVMCCVCLSGYAKNETFEEYSDRRYEAMSKRLKSEVKNESSKYITEVSLPELYNLEFDFDIPKAGAGDEFATEQENNQLKANWRVQAWDAFEKSIQDKYGVKIPIFKVSVPVLLDNCYADSSWFPEDANAIKVYYDKSYQTLTFYMSNTKFTDLSYLFRTNRFACGIAFEMDFFGYKSDKIKCEVEISDSFLNLYEVPMTVDAAKSFKSKHGINSLDQELSGFTNKNLVMDFYYTPVFDTDAVDGVTDREILKTLKEKKKNETVGNDRFFYYFRLLKVAFRKGTEADKQKYQASVKDNALTMKQLDIEENKTAYLLTAQQLLTDEIYQVEDEETLNEYLKKSSGATDDRSLIKVKGITGKDLKQLESRYGPEIFNYVYMIDKEAVEEGTMTMDIILRPFWEKDSYSRSRLSFKLKPQTIRYNKLK